MSLQNQRNRYETWKDVRLSLIIRRKVGTDLHNGGTKNLTDRRGIVIVSLEEENKKR